MAWMPSEATKKARKRKWDQGPEIGSSLSQPPETGATSSPILNDLDVMGGLSDSLSPSTASLSSSSLSLPLSSAPSPLSRYSYSSSSLSPPYSSPASYSLSSPSPSSSSSAVLPMSLLSSYPSPVTTPSSEKPASREDYLKLQYPGAELMEPVAKKEERPYKAGSTYAALSDPLGNFLVGLKNKHAKWGEWGDKEIPIVNNPEQHVLPGGGLEGNDFTDENIILNALKELEEETGFRANRKTGKIMLHHRTKSPMEVASFKGPLQVIRPEKGANYAGVHIPVDTLETMMKIFSELREVDALKDRKQHERYRKDDELAELKILSEKDARKYFTTETNKKPRPALYPNGSPYTYKRINFRTKKEEEVPVMTKTGAIWFDNILKNIKPATSASSSSGSSTSGEKS